VDFIYRLVDYTRLQPTHAGIRCANALHITISVWPLHNKNENIILLTMLRCGNDRQSHANSSCCCRRRCCLCRCLLQNVVVAESLNLYNCPVIRDDHHGIHC